jgi:hypothetical protein
MLKSLSVFAALVALGAGPVHAQKQEAVLQLVDVPGAGFDLVLASPKPGAAALPDLGNTPDALVMHLHGGELAVVFEDAQEMLKAIDTLRSPVWADSAGQRPVALYRIPKAGPITSGGRATGVEVVRDERTHATANPSR